MNDCYKTNFDKFDWLIFYELDEFIHLHNYTNIKDFLNQPKFNNCQLIHLNLICHTDNDKLYYENKPLAERFPELVPSSRVSDLEVKSILKGHIPNLRIQSMHTGTKKVRNCNGYGHSNKYRVNVALEPDREYYYIDHYYSKSTEEFVDKLARGDAFSTSVSYYMQRVQKYFLQSNCTLEKINMIEKGTGLNLSEFRKKLSFNL